MYIRFDSNDTMYVADRNSNCLRKVTTDGNVTTIAGVCGASNGYQDGPASSAKFFWPAGLEINAAGVVYVSDQLNGAIRTVYPNGTVSTFAVISTGGSQDVWDITMDANGNIFGVWWARQTIIKIPGGSNTQTTYVGTYNVDGNVDGTGTNARFASPGAITIDRTTGKIYVANAGDGHIRLITPGQ